MAGAVVLPGGAGALFSQAVEVRLLEELLTGQPLRRVHPQAALNHQSHQQETRQRHALPQPPAAADIIPVTKRHMSSGDLGTQSTFHSF